MKPTRRRRAAYRPIRAAAPKPPAAIRVSRRSKSPARSSRAARICARRITAAVIGRRRVMRSRSIRRPATSDFVALSEPGATHAKSRRGRPFKPETGRTQPPQYSACQYDHRRSFGIRLDGVRSGSHRTIGGLGRKTQHRRHHGRRYRLVQHRRLPSGHHVRQDAEPRQARRRRHAISPITTQKQAAPQAAPISSPAKSRCALVLPLSDRPAPTSACRTLR